MTEISYYQKRLDLLGITPALNKVKLLKYDSTEQKNVLKEEQIFRKHEKGIEIIVYDLNREQPTYTGEQSRYKKNWSIIRFEKPIVRPNGDIMKYGMPKGQGSYPFFPPHLLDKYDNRETIHTLFLTEGFFKAFKGAMHGLDIIGLPSITHLKNKENGALNADILRLMNICGVKRVVWLTDGDCIDISSKATEGKEEVDLYKRPSAFYSSITTFKQLVDDYDVEKYFMHVDTDAIWHDNKTLERSALKGLDDIMVAFPEKIQEIADDAKSVSKNGYWFHKINITIGLSKVRDYFRLQNVTAFILFHQERNPGLKGKEFIFLGTRYKYNEDKGECEIIVPGDAKSYFRVGDHYHEWLHLPNQYNQLEKVFHERQKTTITDDYGKNFIKHIPKYKAFCNVPNHINFQQVINNCFNVYSQIDYLPSEEVCTTEDCPTIMSFIHHIFGTKSATFTNKETREKKEYLTVDLGLDYLQILYEQPWRKLPILCLVSKENNTGKSTFANFLRMMLGANVAIVGNADLAGDFNAHWATKSVVVCDETKIDKQHVIERIKALSTAKKIWMNAKGKGQVELDCFIKFVLITNNEESFIYAGDDDIRYWVIKVHVIKTENPNIMDQFVEEMPAFLSYLSKRKLSTENRNRMWFHPELLKTEALKKVIQYSRPTIQKELTHKVREMFLDFGLDEILMTTENIRKEFFGTKYEANYVNKMIKDDLKIDHWHKLDNENVDLFGNPTKIYGTTRYSYPKWDYQSKEIGKPPENVRVDVQCLGRPFVFKRDQFITDEELKGIFTTPENAYINQMSPTANNTYLNGNSNGHVDPVDQLPF